MIEPPAKTLERELQIIKQIASFHYAAISLKNKISINPNGLVHDEPISHAINKFISFSELEADIVSKSLLVSCWGSFEQFLSLLLKYGAQLLTKRNFNSDSIPHNIRNKHTRVTAEALPVAIEGSRRQKLNTKDLINALQSSYDNDNTCVFNTEPYAIFSGAFNIDTMKHYLGRLGYDLNWLDIGKKKELKDFFTGSPTSVGNKTKRFLDALIIDRNIYAHTGGHSHPLTHSIDDSTRVLLALAQQLQHLIEIHIQSMKEDKSNTRHDLKTS